VQKALVHEHIIQVLSLPINLTSRLVIKTKGGSREIKGFGCAHFAALQFISKMLSNHVLLEDARARDPKQAEDIRNKCVCKSHGIFADCYAMVCK
jgi:hypothetical protein